MLGCHKLAISLVTFLSYLVTISKCYREQDFMNYINKNKERKQNVLPSSTKHQENKILLSLNVARKEGYAICISQIQMQQLQTNSYEANDAENKVS